MADYHEMDKADPLKTVRDLFELPEGVIYLDGNSLGARPKVVLDALLKTVRDEWGQDLIRSWNSHDWINLPQTTGELIAPIIGAAPGQVICADSTSVNLFKLMAAATSLQRPRRTVLSQQDNFPTDLYMAEGLSQLVGDDRLTARLVPVAELIEAMTDDVALLHLTHVNFRDGELHDMQQLTRAAHEAGALVLWDLSHSAGVVPLALDDWQVDLAVGCGYKYLNGGPGAPAYLYVNKALQDKLQQPLSGWMGHKNPFDFAAHYEPHEGMNRFLTGTPSVLSMRALEAAVEIYGHLDMKQVRAKSMKLTEYFVSLTKDLPGTTLVSPADPEQRGSQISLQHDSAFAIVQALIARGVIGDYREPDLMRFGFSPLYNSFSEVHQAATILSDVLATGEYLESRFSERGAVT